MINDGRVMCRTTMPLCAAPMNEWRVAAPMSMYIYNYNNDTGMESKEKVENKLFENVVDVQHIPTPSWVL